MRKTHWKLGLTALAAGLSALLAVAPAHAVAANSGVYGTTFVDGGDKVTDDFGEHFSELGNSLCNGCADSWNTDLVVVWQSILASEGLLRISDIDGQFGPGTATATKQWQSRYGLTADGWVGDDTWSKADDRLYWDGIEWAEAVIYEGREGSVSFLRGNSDSYNHPADGGAYEITGVERGSDGYWFKSSTHRIHFNKRTITVAGSW